MQMQEKIAKSLVTSVGTGEEVAVESLWGKKSASSSSYVDSDDSSVGCISRELSTLKPQLDAHNVRLIAIGLEELGVEEFVAGEFFDGELYVDAKKECYQSLGFKRFNYFNIFPGLLTNSSREATSKSKEENVPGDCAGDAMQNGGAIIVSAGGTEQLLFYKQEGLAEHVALADVLKALNIDEPPPCQGQGQGQGATGTADACDTSKVAM